MKLNILVFERAKTFRALDWAAAVIGLNLELYVSPKQ
jgi:hypothetical protein